MEATALTELGDQLLAHAHEEHSGRAAATVHGGRGHALRQTVIALTAESGGGNGAVGDLLVIPPERHALHADEDSVVLLTVVKPA